MSSMTISNDGDLTRVQTSVELGREEISLSILIPTQNQTLLEAQVLAYEKGASHLSQLAASIRRQISPPTAE